MKNESVKLIDQYAPCDEYKTREEYSGRGMYGKTTGAFVGHYTQLFEVAANVADEIQSSEMSEEASELLHELKNFLEDCSSLRQDSMGYDDIYY